MVGPLICCRGFDYIRTNVDRLTRWSDADPIKKVMTKTIVLKFLNRLVYLYGCSVMVTADRGAQFESQLVKMNFIL